MTARLVHIVGLQKSGTTLLGRLLERTGAVTRVFKGEGNDFWGNEPAFAPTAFPAETIYQESVGRLGHEAGAADATGEMRRVLDERLAAASGDATHVLNKNPYNVVRLSWVRSIFPDATIVAMTRRPAPNVYSLLMKFHAHEGRGLSPHDGWWGDKPRDWESIVCDDKVEQCARQWQAVNETLQRDLDVVDLVIEYRQLCHDQRSWVPRVIEAAGADGHWPADVDPKSLRCRDEEHRIGASLRSKNRLFRPWGDFSTPVDERVELPALTDAQIDQIEANCTAFALAESSS